MSSASLKKTAHQIIDTLPDDASWKDLIHELSVLQDIEDGLRDSDTGRTTDNATVRKQFGLPERRHIGRTKLCSVYNKSTITSPPTNPQMRNALWTD